MQEFISLILAALERGKVEVTIQVSYVRATKQTGDEFTVTCPNCSWSNSYSNPGSAARALRAHHQHCPKSALDLQWITNMHDAETDED